MGDKAPILAAAESGDVEQLKALIANGADLETKGSVSAPPTADLR